MGMALFVLQEAMTTLSHSSCGHLSSLVAEGKVSQGGHLDRKLRYQHSSAGDSQVSEQVRKTSEPSVSVPDDVGFLTPLTDLVVNVLKINPS